MSDGNQGYRSLALEAVLDHLLAESSLTLLDRQNLLTSENETHLQSYSVTVRFMGMVLGWAWTTS